VSQADDLTPYRVLEQHSFYDLDGDGYAEPVILTVVEQLKKVVRIAPCYGPDDVKFNGKGEVVRIHPLEFFTEYSFVPSPDGGSMGMGFALLLGGVSEAVDTLMRQLIDAGTLSNLQSGFIGRGIRIRGGDYSLAPGQWKQVNSTGDDLRKGIVPLPVKDPSSVLFSLLGMLIQAGQDIGSTQDIMMGKTPGQNTPATTSMAALDQGLKVYAAIMRRQYSAQEREMQKIYRMDREFIDIEEYASVVDAYVETTDEQGQTTIQPVPPEELAQDFQGPVDDVCPAADPDVMSDIQALAKAEAIVNRAAMRPDIYDGLETEKIYLAALGVDGIEHLVKAPQPPQPDLNLQFEMQKWQEEKELRINELQLQAVKIKADIGKRTAEVEKIHAQAQSLQTGAAVDAQKYVDDTEHSRVELISKRLKDLQDGRLQERKLDIEEKKVDREAKKAKSD